MKINVSKIKRWDFEKRLSEIKKRLNDLREGDIRLPNDNVEEIRQIVEYWLAHIKSKEEKRLPKKNKTRSVNIFS